MRKHLFYLLIPLLTFFGYGQILEEGFDDITTLTGNGWIMTNQSSPIGTTNWFQGNSATFPAQSGAGNSYIGANFNNATNVGTISNWLIFPTLNLKDGDELRFWTRSAGTDFPDRLEVRASSGTMTLPSGAANTGSFSNLLLTIDPDLTGVYPTVWTEFVVTISGVGATAMPVNLAFRYFVTDAGPLGNNSNYIGIDTVSVFSNGGGDPGESNCDDTEYPIATTAGALVTASVNITDTGVIGDGPDDFKIEDVVIDLMHTWATDLEIVLISPSGREVTLSSDNGGNSGLDERALLKFTDSSVNSITSWTNGAPLADYRAEGGPTAHPIPDGPGPGVDLNTEFAGESVNGNWQLRIYDDTALDGGTLFSFCLNLSGGSVTEPGEESCNTSGGPIGPALGSIINMTLNITDTGVIGTGEGEFSIDQVSVDLEHTWAADIEMVLISPSGTEVTLTSDNGGSNGLDVRAILTFKDSSTNNVTDWTTGPPLADYRAEGGPSTHPIAGGAGPGVDLNTEFAGEPINGMWTLRVYDDAEGDGGTLYSFCMTLSGGTTEPGGSDCDETSYTIATTNGATITASVNVVDTGVIGAADGEFTIDEVSIDIMHTFADDLEIVLISPSGTEATLTSDNGGSTGLDERAMLVFNDSSTNDITTWDNTPPLADYRAEGGETVHPIPAGNGPGIDLNTVFAGEPVNGTWQLRVYDDASLDGGTVYAFCLAITENGGGGPVDGCLEAENGQYPSTTFTPSCSGAPEVITSLAWTGEYSMVNVTAGTEYVFSSSIATDYITISDENGTVAYDAGTTPVTWTATANETVRFYLHFDSDCNWAASGLRSRIVQCGDILPPPSNDDCANAIEVSCGDSVSGDTTFATNSGGNAAGDVFYSYTGTGTPQNVTVSLCGSSYDTYLRVFTDCTLSNEITFNDDFCGLQSQLTFTADGTSTYYIMVEGFSGNVGNFVMDVSCADVPPPPTDCEDFEVLSNNLENGLFFGGDTAQRLAVDVPVADAGFTVFGMEPTVAGEASSFNFTIYADGGGLPGAELATRTGIITGSVVTGNNFGFDFIKYTVQFNEPFDMEANTTYWIEVESDAVAWESTSAFGSMLGNGDVFWNTNVSGWTSTGGDEFVFNLLCTPVGLDDLTSFDFAYYPNPVKDVLNFTSKKGVESVEIFNLAGQRVMNNAKVTNNQINVDALTPGTYVFRVTLEGGQIETFKIIKK